MKREVIIILIVIITIGFSAFDFNKKHNSAIACDSTIGDTLIKQADSSPKYLNLSFTEIIKPPINQDLFYLVKGKYDRSTTKEILQGARLIDDIIEGYPNSWINDYRSVEIMAVRNNKELKAISPDNKLTKEQRDLLNTVEVNDEIHINVKHNKENIVTKNIENRKMYVSLMVIPAIEAEYIGGYKHMIAYFSENSSDKISAISLDPLEPSSILFTVTKNGDIDNVILNKTTGDAEIDKLLLELVSKMPKWKPAENSKGSKVNQQFEFFLGMDGC